MRGNVDRHQAMFIAFNIEDRIPEDHPPRPINSWCDRVLAKMSREFTWTYGTTGQPGIPPECLIKALLLRALFSILSEGRMRTTPRGVPVRGESRGITAHVAMPQLKGKRGDGASPRAASGKETDALAGVPDESEGAGIH